MSDTVAQDQEQENNRAQDILLNEEGVSMPIQDDGMAVSQCQHENQSNPFKLNLPETEEDPSLRWVILDAWKITQCGKVHRFRRLVLAVTYFWERGHRRIIVCIPEWMRKEHILISDIHYLNELQRHLQDNLVYTPDEAGKTSVCHNFMEKLSKHYDAMIITLTGPDSWSETNNRILQFMFMKDAFKLPVDPEGKNGPDRSTLLHSSKNIKSYFDKEWVQNLMKKCEAYSKMVNEFKKLDLSFSEEPGKDELPLVIIDGSNIAMSHGQDMFYSCFGIYRAVQHFWNKGYRNITACVPNYRRHSPSTIHGHEYLEKLSERGLVSWTPSKCYDDRPMLEEARAKTGRIVTNDRFKDFGPEWKETKKRCIPFEFKGNHFIPFPISSEAVGTSSVQPAAMSVNGANDKDLGPTSEAPDDNTHI